MRKTLMIVPAALAALSLGACGDGAPNAMVENAAVAGADDSMANMPAPPEASPAASADPSTAPSPGASPSPDAGTGIPVALHGRWGLVPADCTSTRGDNKGLLTIGSDTLRFYESRGILGKVAERDGGRIVADFAMSGEGQEWTRRMELDVQDGGNTLVRREQGADAMPEALRYRKCA